MDEPEGPGALRVALFSGNYNYVKDGANQALNCLVAHLENRGHRTRVYSPVTATPAFEPAGTLVGVPSVPIPGRGEYRLALGLPRRTRRDLDAFAPDLVHVSAPDWLGHAVLGWAARRGVPGIASVHTRFETYFDYYRLGFVRRGAERALARFYALADTVLVPSRLVAAQYPVLRRARHVGAWSRGVDRTIFHPRHRSLAWRQALGIAPEAPVALFVGRLVMEKGLDRLADIAREMARIAPDMRLLVVGDGPARAYVEQQVPGAHLTGFLTGEALGRAYASADIFLNPSTTETFGNVTLEAMAAGTVEVAAHDLATRALVTHEATGLLVGADDAAAYARAMARLAAVPAPFSRLRAAALVAADAYEWDRVNDAVIAAYRETLERRRGPAGRTVL
jgi:glycosyltransferase involved in cell wall biosynthesis